MDIIFHTCAYYLKKINKKCQILIINTRFSQKSYLPCTFETITIDTSYRKNRGIVTRHRVKISGGVMKAATTMMRTSA